MPVADLPERPAFHSQEPGFEEIQSAPISRLAIVALVLGFLSLFTPLSTSLLPLAMIAAVFSAVVIWRLSVDRSASGMWMGQVGLGFAVLGAGWVITSVWTRNDYLYRAATPHAQVYLDLMSAGKLYQAFELTKSEPARQISGTDLKAYYQNLTAPEDKDQIAGFLSSDHARELMSHGARADWELVRRESVNGHNQFAIKLVMADSTQPEKKKIAVTLVRELVSTEQEGSDIAVWHVNETAIVKE